MHKLDSIQIGRAIAALAVVVFHSHLAVTNFPTDFFLHIPFVYEHGFLGVQLFFVISGFIICFVTDRPDFTRSEFFIKRFFRIYPLYAVFCILAFTTQETFALGGRDYSIQTLLTSIAIIPQPSGPIYAVGWSLEYEILFYILAGLLVPIGGINLLGITLACLFIAGKFWEGWDYHLFSGMHQYFLAGIVIYKARGFLPILHYEAKSRVMQWLVNLGDASFSLYLVHWIVFAVANRASNYIASPAELMEVWRFGAIAISVLLAFLLHFYVEQPFISLGHKLCSKPNAKKLHRE